MGKDIITNLVSVITPAFNSAKLISETIQSVQNQTYPNWELIVVIDRGTTDNTEEIVSLFSQKDPRVKLTKISDGRGISLSRNRALTQAAGEWISFLDSDDLWLPEKLERQITFMKIMKSDFSCAGYRKISQDGKSLGKLRLPPLQQTYADLLGNNLISCPTVMYSQLKLGQFMMEEHAHEDYILWLEIIKKAKICHGLQEDLARYRIVENSRSMNVNRSGSRWKVYRKFEKLSVWKSTFFFSKYAITAMLKRLFF